VAGEITAPSCPSCLSPLQCPHICDTDSLAQATAVQPLEISHRFGVSFICEVEPAAVEQLLHGSLTTRAAEMGIPGEGEDEYLGGGNQSTHV